MIGNRRSKATLGSLAIGLERVSLLKTPAIQTDASPWTWAVVIDDHTRTKKKKKETVHAIYIAFLFFSRQSSCHSNTQPTTLHP